MQIATLLIGICVGAGMVLLYLSRTRAGMNVNKCEDLSRKLNRARKELDENNQDLETSTSIEAINQRRERRRQERKKRILEMYNEYDEIANDDVEEELGVSDATATRYLKELEDVEQITATAESGRYVTYRLSK